jgi:V8-like Glu-specific endopeptidase
MNKRIVSIVSLALLASSPQVFAADAKPNATHAPSYVKLQMSYTQNNKVQTNICGGVFIAKDMVLTASHCIPDAWSKSSTKKITFSYGKQFSTKANLRAGTSWVKFDPAVDLAIIRMDRELTTASGATVATLDKACTSKPSYTYPKKAISYHHMASQGVASAMSVYKTTTTTISSYDKSALANGQSYITPNIALPGDSGSPLFSDNKILIGTYNGNGGNKSYFASLCMYRTKIDSSMKELAKLK